ncbi:hypothetical protein HIM_02179 [Hirsutella minnesotensis 3608]|nr:hypothetical protein HIM_02179 [Hirsutella minnesotensis 3608]
MPSVFSPIAGNASLEQLDHQQLEQFIMPDLHDMAQNQDLLERVRDRRFNRDDPPPYRSPSPEEDGFEDGQDGGFDLHPLQAIAASEKAKMEELIDEPLTETELRETQRHFEMFSPAYNPGRLYEQAADDAQQRVELCLDGDREARNKLYHGRSGGLRLRVLVRHGIKKRWQRLGVWNPDWGIPGRVDMKPHDQPFLWKWKWQGDVPDCGAEPLSRYTPRHPNSRAMRLRQGLRRRESGIVPPPRHSLDPDASQSTAEAFITSRPWYLFAMECEEERTRLARLSGRPRRLYDEDPAVHVWERWVEREDEEHQPRLGWKWRHESLSPEPPDATETDPDWTPSEIDALEAIPPPSPEPPRHTIQVPTGSPKPSGNILLWGKVVNFGSSSLEQSASEDRGQPVQNHTEDIPSQPTTRQTRGRQSRPVSANAAFQESTEPLKLRRSARIAAKARQKVLESAALPPTNSDRTRVRSAAGSGELPQPKRGRGRPPKSLSGSKTSKPQGVAKKRRGRPPKKR